MVVTLCESHVTEDEECERAQVIRGISSKYILNFGCDFIIFQMRSNCRSFALCTPTNGGMHPSCTPLGEQQAIAARARLGVDLPRPVTYVLHT